MPWLLYRDEGGGGVGEVGGEMVVVMTAAAAATVVWQHGDDVVVRWWHEGIGSSGGCGVACQLGWPKFWPDGGAAPENL
nr:hypothetical protein [Tanacetum cinerariifolium]